MAPKKFALFKGRSRDQPEQPSTENLLQSQSTSTDSAMVFPPSPPSPIPSTSRGYHNDPNFFTEFAMMHIADSDDDEDDSDIIAMSRRVALAKAEEAKMNYRALPSTSATSTTTLQELQDMEYQVDVENIMKFEVETENPDDATSLDVNSIQFDQSSIVSEDVRYCGAVAAKKPKKNKSRVNQEMTDSEMWHVGDTQVMERLLERNCTANELVKWEAIALARGICTLTTNCVCRDCSARGTAQSILDGDGGIASAHFFGAITIGCDLQ